MTPADWERAAAIYLPLMAAAIAWLLGRRKERQFAACLLSVLWAAPSLLALDRVNEYAGWWTFAPGSAAEYRDMPLEMLFGWVILWGIVPQLALPRLGIGWSAAVMVGADCIAMPMARNSVMLHRNWFWGEAVGVLMVLAPALCVGKWTRDATHLRGRAALQVATAAGVLLFLLPEMIFVLRPGRGWSAIFVHAGWMLQVWLEIVVLLALPGLAAVMEFVERGAGTPIPYDPPRRLVTSGVYRYVANPMQLSSMLVMIVWAWLLRNGWMLAAAGISVAYGAGLAEWDERQELVLRFGAAWRDYRSEVRSWWPRWRPYHAGAAAVLYVARTCGPCSEVRRWIERRMPVGLEIVDAEALPAGSIRRLRYDPCDGGNSVEGVRAMGRAFEHLHLGWALMGAGMRLPLVWCLIQILMDASGLGPREIVCDAVEPDGDLRTVIISPPRL